ncbi:MAG: 2,3-bisphosphoglycerate-dependent phosphoglycerate mutase [Methanobacteriota archaeon]|mgnify:CR=1 FL=1|nr:MAG: 2,3-bisphosphoglycerate-dependent phosphoglycerate mutase [Euryarchaeota archaeon]|tara:strand:+ start:2628 stop:3236 length:609 start_codon:yes stop_codon:yes gene_type:complete
MKAVSLLILVRHGQSTWNAKKLFTGWTDVELTDQGVIEAVNAGKLLCDIDFDFIYTSKLKRAQKTAEIIIQCNSKSKNVKIIKDYRLNERHYGDLQGVNHDVAREKFGAEQIQIWRRSFDIPPPNGESLKMTSERTIPCLEEEIIPELTTGKNILVVAHGNSLRSIVMKIEDISKEDIVKLEIPTGKPISYSFENNSFIFQK